MSKSQKRARQKANKEAAAAARVSDMRRRTMIRLVTVVGVLAVVAVIAALLSLGTGNDGRAQQSQSSEQGSTQAGTQQGKQAGAQSVACEGEQPAKATPGTYEKPADVLEANVDYGAVMKTSCGTIDIDLAEDSAPVNVNNFVFLARKGFYDGLTFHRVVKDFVIQGGDPDNFNGHPPDGPGYEVKDELPSGPSAYVFGVVAMANAGPDTAGSQFFIVVHKGRQGQVEPAGLEPDYSVIGKVDRSSYNAIEEIATRPVKGDSDPNEPEEPVNPVYIESIKIVQR